MADLSKHNKFYSQVKQLLKSSCNHVVRTINQTMVLTYFEIGHMIIEEKQQGKDRATYGKRIVEGLSIELSREFGKGFSQRNLEQIRQFYLNYSIPQTLSAELRNTAYN